MKTKYLLSLTAVLCIFLSAPANADEGKDESGKGGPPASEYREDRGDDSYFYRRGYARLNIPKGHYPAPGECRIWFPDCPAGQQPPPGRCEQLRKKVPKGAWLIQHPKDDPDHVHVVVYDERRPASIKVIGEFEIGSGCSCASCSINETRGRL